MSFMQLAEKRRSVRSYMPNPIPEELLRIGYPNDESHEKRRKSLEELVRYEHW